MLDAYVVNVFDEVAGSELAVANAYRDLVVSDGGANLLIYLPLDANYGLTDQSGNGRNGTAAGGVTIGAIAGPGDGLPWATDFDGVDDRVTTTYSPYTNATIRTYEGWAWRDDTLANHNLISSDVGGTAPVLQLSSGNQNVTWDPDVGTAGGVVTWAAAWPGSAQWVHWMLVFDEGGDTAKLYINGSLVSSQAATQAYNASPGNYEVGCRGTNSAPFNGRQAHVAVYNTDKSSLAAAHAAAYPYAALLGNTSISVLDLTDFNLDPEGGSEKIDDGTNNETATYTVPSGSTGAINLGTALTHNYLPGTKVTVLVNGSSITERWADLREPDGEELLRTLVPQQLRPLIRLGPRDEETGESEHVRAEIEDGDLVVQDLLGKFPVQDLNSVLITTDPDESGGQRVDIDATGVHEYEADGTLAVDLTQANGLDLATDTASGAHATRKVRWVKAGTETGYVQAYETASEDAIYNSVRATDSSHIATAAVQANASIGINSSFAVVWVEAKNGQAGRVMVQAADSGGFATSPTVVFSGDGTSDFLLNLPWQNWTPTFTGWSANPTGGIYRYRQIGKLVHLMIRQPNTGTSNATTKTISLPITATTITNAVWSAPAAITDNGTTLTTSGRAIINSAATTVSFATDWALGAFTAAGAASIRECQVTYEVA